MMVDMVLMVMEVEGQLALMEVAEVEPLGNSFSNVFSFMYASSVHETCIMQTASCFLSCLTAEEGQLVISC